MLNQSIDFVDGELHMDDLLRLLLSDDPFEFHDVEWDAGALLLVPKSACFTERSKEAPHA